MPVPTSSYYDAIRGLVGDDDPDFQIISNTAIDSKIRLVVNGGEVPHYEMDSTGLQIIPRPATASTNPGWRDMGDYRYAYGENMDLTYAMPYTQFFDSSFYFYVNYTPLARQYPDDNDLTPAGNRHEWELLVYTVAHLFVASMSNFHMRTRSATETIAQPKDLLYTIELKLDELRNGGRASERPVMLPLIAIGIRSLYSGLWWSSNGGMLGYEYLGFSLSF